LVVDDLQAAAAQNPVRREGRSSDGLFAHNGHAKDAKIEQGKGNQHGLKPQWDSHLEVLLWTVGGQRIPDRLGHHRVRWR
jgi:predicted glutamine amidotransferase